LNYVLKRCAIAGVLVAALAPLAASYQCAWAETPPVATAKPPLTVVAPPGDAMPDAYKLNMMIRTTLIALNQANLSRLQAGVAVAMAAETPQITSSQNFGMRIGWGNYLNEANGVAASAIGVVCRGCFSNGDRIAVDGAVGAGWSSYKTYDSGNVVAGRAGISWGW
jgi:hypothetical protein